MRDRRSTPVSSPEESAEAADARQFLQDFRRRMAEQGLIVRMANPRPDWTPTVLVDVSGDEASATVVRMRRGEA